MVQTDFSGVLYAGNCHRFGFTVRDRDAAPDAQAAHLKHKKQFGGGRGKKN